MPCIFNDPPKIGHFLAKKTPKFSKNAKQKFGKKGGNFGRIIINARDILDDIIMYQTNPCRVLQNLQTD